MADLIGKSLGRYHILEQLGEGGMAVVYKAFDTRLERHVAIKVILPGKEQSDKFLKRFEREAKALAQLSHPNIVKVIDYGEHDGLPYLVMEYLPGGTLKQKLMGKPISWQEAIQIILPISRALGYAHEQKIIHRDVKSSNILITQSGEPMLSDFGIAKILEAEETLDLTGAGVGVGTPEYMSPEQAQGKNVDARSDVYSLGVVFYEMVTGRKPYQAETPMAVVWKLASEPLPSPRQFQPDLTDQIEAVLIKALARNPENRFQTMQAFGQALNQLGATTKTSFSIRGKLHPLLGAVLLIMVTSMAFLGWRIVRGGSPVSNPSQPAPESTETVISPSKPAPEETGSQTAVIPTTVGDIPPAIVTETGRVYYDQFEDSAFDGSSDYSLWNARTSNCEISQSDGALKFTNKAASPHQECDLYASKPNPMIGSELGVFEVQEFVSSDYNKKSVMTQEIQFRSDSLPGGTWFALCGLIADGNSGLSGFMNVSFFGTEKKGYDDYYGTVSLDSGYDTWHTVRLEADPETFRITCNVDGQSVGSVAPRDADILKTAEFARVLEAARGPQAIATSYVDNVYFEPDSDLPQASGTYLMDITPLDAKANKNYLGYGVFPWSEGPMSKGGPIFLLGRYFEHAIFAHATSSLRYDVGGKYQRLETQAYYFGPCKPMVDGAIFRIFGDNKLLYESPTLNYGDEATTVDVSLIGVNQLMLTTDQLTNGSCDWTIWLDPILAR
jgi:serine/threonine protein kinase